MRQKKPFPFLRILVHVLGAAPLVFTLAAALTGHLGANPIQDVEQRLGRTALYFLVGTLAVTPITTLTGWQALLPRRRALGLYTFLYACLHFLVFIAIDYGFDFVEIGRLILEKPFILLGVLTGLLLLPLAVTSFDRFTRAMGKNWKWLHRLVYIAGVMVIIHYAWAKKGNLFSLQGDILKPLLWGLLVILLLVLRIPAVRKAVIMWRQSLTEKARQKRQRGRELP